MAELLRTNRAVLTVSIPTWTGKGGIGMILSFDLDGGIAGTDNGLLNLLHMQACRMEGNEGAFHYLQQYYARRPLILDPRSLTGPGDEYHIITGRVPSAHAITKKWVKHWLGPEPVLNLHLVGTARVEKMFEKGETDKASIELGRSKLRVIHYIKAQVHFDNNPLIVAYLRSQDVTSVLVGGGLL